MLTAKPILGFLGQTLLAADKQLTDKHIYYLGQLGIRAIYVHDSSLGKIEVEDLVSADVRSESRALVAKVINELDATGKSKRGFGINDKEVLAVVTKIVEELISSEDVLVQLSDIRAKGGYLFAHSVNCAVLATLVASRMNYDQKTLKLLATGALLHDIGLVVVPRMVLEKPGSLTDAEYEAVKGHPLYGYEMFKRSRLFTERAGEIIRCHHERFSGQGYPRGLKGKEIASLARIMAVVDVFDALTSDKVYRDAYPVHEAYMMLQSWGGSLFDIEILNVFLAHVTPYPVGTHVTLSNGESGIVITNKAGFALCPVVRVLYKAGFDPHPSPFDLDLKRALNLTVTGVIEKETLPARADQGF